MITYTMYLRQADEGPPDFEPVICANDADAIRKARELLNSRPGVESVDVYFGDQLLVTVS
jgi:predicted dinucleotide-binding enzyme